MNQSVKFLGMRVDAGLTWRAHGDCLAGRLRSAIFLLRRLTETCSPPVVRTAYFSLFHSLASYGLLIWGHTPTLKRIFALQRRAVRTIGGLGYREDCRHIFKDLRIITLPSLYVYESLKQIHSNIQQYRNNADVHGYGTRALNNIRGERLRLDRSRNALNYHGIKFYNMLEESTRNLPHKRFLNYVKEHLIDTVLYAIQEFQTF